MFFTHINQTVSFPYNCVKLIPNQNQNIIKLINIKLLFILFDNLFYL